MLRSGLESHSSVYGLGNLKHRAFLGPNTICSFTCSLNPQSLCK